MNANQNYALIDNASGYIWWVGVAASPELACAAATLETGREIETYESTHALASNEGGYKVYAAPADFTVDDGQDENEIAAVSSFPFIGKFRSISAD